MKDKRRMPRSNCEAFSFSLKVEKWAEEREGVGGEGNETGERGKGTERG